MFGLTKECKDWGEGLKVSPETCVLLELWTEPLQDSFDGEFSSCAIIGFDVDSFNTFNALSSTPEDSFGEEDSFWEETSSSLTELWEETEALEAESLDKEAMSRNFFSYLSLFSHRGT